MLSNSGKCTDSSPIAINQLNKEAKSQQPNQWRRSQPLAVWTFSDRNISSLFMMIALFRWRNKRWKHQMFSVRIMSFKCSRVCRSVFDSTWQESEWRKRKITHTNCIELNIIQKESVWCGLNDINWWLEVVFLDFKVPSLFRVSFLSVDSTFWPLPHYF